MLRFSLQPGQVLPLSRALHVQPDPLALFAHVCEGGQKPNTILMESADASTKSGLQSVLITHGAVRVVCRGQSVQLDALTLNGQHALAAIHGHLVQLSGVRVMHSTDARLMLHFSSVEQLVSESERLMSPSPMDALRQVATSWDLVNRPAAMSLLIAGVFSYDALGLYEALPKPNADQLDYPDFDFVLPEAMIVVNHQTRTTQVMTYVYGGADSERCYHDAQRRVAALVEAVEAAPRALPVPALNTNVDVMRDVDVDMDDEHFAQVVKTLKAHIEAGDVFQIVASRTYASPCDDPLRTYTILRALNPSPYMFFMASDTHTIFGASPETSVKVSGTPKMVEIRPIAGTRRRGLNRDGQPDRDLDARIEAELRTNTKELAEHMMLVDLARNDVARVSVPGTRHVERLLSVERYSHVMHLVSYVEGQLKPEYDALHAYVASMNMGTLVGAPKVRAAQLLRQYEPTKRGPYGGAIGYLTCDGEMDTAIIIRSAVVKDDVAFVRAGAGVVHDSDPLAEADETTRKAAAVLRALALAREENQ